jgi:pyruvate/2-oxoglutarate dehydrogenase complex dihydrolipoamide acyltransferase (E2) component
MAAAAAVREASEVVEQARTRTSPLVRRLAQEHGVDLSQLTGTGIEGRVTKDDILNFIEQRSAQAAARPAAPRETPAVTPPGVEVGRVQPPPTAPMPAEARPTAAEPSSPAPQPLVLAEGDQIIELTPMRRMIAEHMVRSKRTSPHATTVHEVDMTNVVRWREGVKDEFQRREGVPLTYVPFVIKATVEALKAYPILNSSWVDDKIVLRKAINIGVAISIEAGLIVPVIKDADQKSIAGLAKALNDLVARARANRLTLPDVQGATFTVNNVGTFGSLISVPIINQPQAAILSMASVNKRPVVIDDSIAIRSMMYISLSFDHRIVDGETAGRFMQRVRQWLEGFGPSVPLY